MSTTSVISVGPFITTQQILGETAQEALFRGCREGKLELVRSQIKEGVCSGELFVKYVLYVSMSSAEMK